MIKRLSLSDYESTLSRPVYRSTSGVAALFTGQMTCYFNALSGKEQGLVAAYRLVRKVIGEHLTWYRTEAQRHSRAIRPKDLEAFETWFSSPASERDEYEMVMGSGTTIGEIGSWAFSFGVERNELPNDLGHFQFNVSGMDLVSHPEPFQRLAIEVFKAFPWTSANAGFGIAYDIGDVDPRRNAAIRAHAMRYVGADCNDLLAEGELPSDTIKTVNWLTFINPALAAKVPALASVANDPTSNVSVETLGEHGVLVRAGDTPLLGDCNRQEDMHAYEQADALLRPIRARQIFPLPGFSDEEETSRWLNRFGQANEIDDDESDDQA